MANRYDTKSRRISRLNLQDLLRGWGAGLYTQRRGFEFDLALFFAFVCQFYVCFLLPRVTLQAFAGNTTRSIHDMT